MVLKGNFRLKQFLSKYPKQFDRIFKSAGKQQNICAICLRSEMDKSYLPSYPILLQESTDISVYDFLETTFHSHNTLVQPVSDLSNCYYTNISNRLNSGIIFALASRI